MHDGTHRHRLRFRDCFVLYPLSIHTYHAFILILIHILHRPSQQTHAPFPAAFSFSEVRSYLTRKYAFLWEPRQYLDACVGVTHRVQQVNVIYKVEAVSKHYYPPLNNSIDPNTTAMENSATSVWVDLASSTPVRGRIATSSNAGEVGTAPFRTISHYGFNCPLTSAPTIMLHPEHKSIWQTVSEQRQKVFSFIDLATLTKEKRKMLNVLTAAATTTTTTTTSTLTVEQQPLTNSSPSYVSEKQIRLEPTPPKRKQRGYSATASSGRSFDDSMDELESMLGSMNLASPRQQQSHDYSLYRSYNFLPRDHALPVDTDASGNGVGHRNRPEAEQGIYQNGDDSGLGMHQSSGRRERATTSNGSSTQEAEAYTPGKHVRLTLSSSPLAGASSPTPTTIEVIINVSLRNAECVQTVQTHEQEFRAKLERVIDEEIHYISQQLATQQRTAQILQEQPTSTRAPLATPTPSQLLQRSNSAPALCHAYSYVDIVESDMKGKTVPSATDAASVSVLSPVVSPEEEDLDCHLSSLENELQRLLNNVIKAHMLHNQAFITDCRARFLQLAEGLASGEISPIKSFNNY